MDFDGVGLVGAGLKPACAGSGCSVGVVCRGPFVLLPGRRRSCSCAPHLSYGHFHREAGGKPAAPPRAYPCVRFAPASPFAGRKGTVWGRAPFVLRTFPQRSGGKPAAPPRAYPCVRFAPRPLSLSERGRYGDVPHLSFGGFCRNGGKRVYGSAVWSSRCCSTTRVTPSIWVTFTDSPSAMGVRSGVWAVQCSPAA